MTDPAFTSGQFWLKAKLFLNRAMDPGSGRSEDELQLWASVGLELLGKWALARVSHALVADVTNDGNHLFRAVGLLDDGKQYTTVAAKTLFTRCAKAFAPFSAEEATRIAGNRNDYLHNTGLGFMMIPADQWWPRFWAQVVILTTAHGVDIEELVGFSRSTDVERHLAQNKLNIKHRVEALIVAARQQLALYKSGSMNAQQHAEWETRAVGTGSYRHSTWESCPACEYERGLLQGEQVNEVSEDWSSDSEDAPSMSGIVLSDEFSCDRCHLVLPSPELLAEASVQESFEAELDPEDYFEFIGPEYGND